MLTDNPSAPLLLVVEDDDSHVFLIRHSLDDGIDDYRLLIVGTLGEAFEAMKRQKPDLILTNYLLADGYGNELVAKVHGACPVIVMTGQGSEELAVTTIKAGAQDYVAKSPETFAALPRIVEMALLEWRLLQERKKIYEAVSRGKREWEQTFDAVPDLIFIVDTEHKISRVNRAMAERCGVQPGELRGRKCHEIFHGLESPPPFCPYHRLMKDGEEQTEEVREDRLSGFFDITVSPLYDETGTLTACVHVARDITERKRAEQERLALEQRLQQAQKLESLGVLAGGIAHDFNNILMIILGHCYLAKEDTDAGAADKERHLTQIEAAANRAADLCRQMLTYAGKSPLQQTRINLRLWLDEVMKMLRPAFKKNVSFRCDFVEVPEITGDKSQIQQIIMNLMVNAVEAIGEESGTVGIGLANCVLGPEDGETDCFGTVIAPGAYVRLEVSDTGCGMSEETRKRIFEPFFSTKFTGRGLGMSAILGIIKSHNGWLQLTSEPGVGTTFRIYFPAAGSAAQKETPQTAEVSTAHWSREPSSGKTVLLVDDEEELRKVAADMLAGMGYAVITATNGREALASYAERGAEIDLILMDLTMPELDGIEAYRELRKTAASIPIVICSGYGNEEVPINDDPHAGFVSKPYRPDEVRNMLTKLLASRE